MGSEGDRGRSEYQQYLDVAVEGARRGGEVLRKYWGKLSQVRTKGYGDFVTEADHESEGVILEVITSQYPDHAILAEESGLTEPQNAASDFLWAVDPLDGTTNYTHTYPCFVVSVALLFKKRPIVGVVYNPLSDEMFCAAEGSGATLNGEKIAVSGAGALEESLLVTGFFTRSGDLAADNTPQIRRLMRRTHGIRIDGSAAIDLANVAAGRIDGFWHRGLRTWDIAAGILLVQEAGGNVTAYDGSTVELDRAPLLATNGRIHQALSDELQG